jgi:hypothetical protein
MKIRFLKTAMALLPCLITATVANAAIINPVYDTKPEYQKYWTPTFKQRTNAMCNLLADYIGDSVTIDITITIGDTAKMKTLAKDKNGNVVKDKDGKDVYDYTIATGSSDTATESTATKYIAKTGTVTVNPDAFFYDDVKKEWKKNNSSLILHEIFHCIGFSKGIRAFNANVSGNTFNGTYTKAVNNQKGFPLNGTNDLSHFRSGDKDVWGIYPRMMASGGNFLSIVDLAALVDIGYNIPKIKSMQPWTDQNGNITTLSFQKGENPANIALNGLFSSSYNEGYSQYGAKNYVSGSVIDDVITNRYSPGNQRLILMGGSGKDSLYVKDSVETVLIGDDPSEVEKGNDNADNYFINNTNSTVIIAVCGPNDTIYLPSGPGRYNGDRLSSVTTVEAAPRTTPEETKFANAMPNFGTMEKPVYYSVRKVTHTINSRKRVEGEETFVNGKLEIGEPKIVITKVSQFTFYCYAKNSTKDAEFQNYIHSKIQYVNENDFNTETNPVLSIVINHEKNYYEPRGN